MMEYVTHTAATVILLRDTKVSGGVQVLAQQRHLTMPFAPGEVGFPGGGEEDQDQGDLRLTAVRELWEEETIQVNPHYLNELSVWVTPREIPSTRHYAVQYYAAKVSNVPTPSATESVRSFWATPAELLQGFEAREMPMVLPTWWHLHKIRNAQTAYEAIQILIEDREVRPILDRKQTHFEAREYLKVADIAGNYLGGNDV